MQVETDDLAKIRDMCLKYYDIDEGQVEAIIVYGGAAKNYVGQDHDPGDVDLNLFYHEEADMTSTAGMPKKIGEYNGLKVEVMRNRIRDGESVKEYMANGRSKRWERIQQQPIVEIYPDIRELEWFTQ